MRNIFVMLIMMALLLKIPALQAQFSAERPDRAARPLFLKSPDDISARAFNTSDINKFGQYLSNIGQFYSSWQELSPTGEWPLGSGHEQMYRMNLYIGVPGNVVQTRTYGAKEWDPVGGYHNPGYGLLATSNNDSTWPLNNMGQPEWPVKDADGAAQIISHLDTYGVFSDLTNNLAATDPSKRLNLKVHQTSYAWNTSLDEDYILLKFQIINDTTVAKDSLYFSMYTDFDAGGFESNNEFGDDRLGLELNRQCMYFYDADCWSDQWNGLPFHMGLVFLQTPEVNGGQPGITDFHYTDNWNEPRDIGDDVVQFQLISSDPRLKNNAVNWPDLFHGDDIHYDDVDLIRQSGDTLVAFTSSGPYHMEPYDTLTFLIALLAGQDYDDFSANVDRIWEVYQNDFQIKAVPQPRVSGLSGDSRAILKWSNEIDLNYIDPVTGRNNLKNYRIYRTEDPNQLTWTLYDSIPRRYFGGELIADAYEYVDSGVLNSFYYFYSVTAVDSLGAEAGIAILASDINTVEVRPGSVAGANAQTIRVVPNPYIISAQWERERLGNISDGEPVRELSFVNLPGNCTIKIFTVDGDLVKTLRHTNGSGTEYWDIRSDYNQMLSTGVYFYHVDSEAGEKIGKFAIIR